MLVYPTTRSGKVSRVLTDLPTVAQSLPLERPIVRGRRRDLGRSAGSLPFFISGDENRLVRFLADSKAPLFDFGNPLLLIGPSGCGKTSIALHVAAKQAIATPIDDRPAQVTFYPAIDFARQYAEAIAADDLPPLRVELDEAPILVIDDLNLIHDKAAAQEELASRIEHRTLAQRATIITCSRLPSEIRGIRPILASRVLPGLTVPISTPSGQTRTVLLREIALHLGLEIQPDLLDILEDGLDDRLPVRSLEAALKHVSLWCRMHESAVSLEAVQSAIDTVGRPEEISLAMIASAVAKHFRIRMSDLRSSSRKQNLVRARSLGMFLSRQLTSKSMHQIGDYYGGRDHTTVLHALRKTESLLNESDELRRAADEVTEKFSIH
jgi:chromosomal replication initiator protein